METSTDLEDLNRARNRVLYEGYKNSLVEWTLSEEWAVPPKASKNRGEVTFKTLKGYAPMMGACNEISGEI